MHIHEEQHVPQAPLLLGVEAAGHADLIRIRIGAEEHIPACQVSVVVAMEAMLVVVPVHFRPLEESADLARGAHAGVVEEFSQRTARTIDHAAAHIQPENHIRKDAADVRIRSDFHRILIKLSDELDAPRAVVDLNVRQASVHDAIDPG